jgi:hypothetical protein
MAPIKQSIHNITRTVVVHTELQVLKTLCWHRSYGTAIPELLLYFDEAGQLLTLREVSEDETVEQL